MDKGLRTSNANSFQHVEGAAASKEEIARGQTGVEVFDYSNNQ